MKKYFFGILIFIFFVSCAKEGAKVKYPTELSPEINQAWKDAEALTAAKHYNDADKAYEIFINTYGYNSLTDSAYFKRGEISFLRGDYDKALGFYKAAYSRVYSPSVAPKARFKAGYSLYRMARFEDAEKELSGIHRKDASAILLTRIDSIGALASKHLNEPEYETVRWHLFLLDDYAEVYSKTDELTKASDVVAEDESIEGVRKWMNDKSITSAQIKKLPLDQYRGKKSGGYALFKLAETLNMEGNLKESTKELKAYVMAYPKHEYYSKATALLNEDQKRTGEGVVKVGLLLPLTGKYALYGESVLHGVECAVGVFEPCKGTGNIQLITRDTGGSAESVAQLIDELEKLDVVAIIGPILSVTAENAAKEAERLGIPLISLSQRTDIPAIGDFIFRNTVTSESQVNALVDYAIGRRKFKRFVVLYPKNNKGKEYNQLFQDGVKALGGKIIATYSYSSNRVELASELMNMNFDPKSIGAYDAVFIPDSFSVAGYIVSTLGINGTQGIQWLGVSRWNDPKLVSIGGEYIEGAVFPEAFYEGSSNYLVRDFISSFKTAYGINPTLLEALGYDSIKIIQEAIRQGAIKRDSIRDALLKINHFEGVAGEMTFNSSRDAVRELPLLTVTNGEIVPVAK